MAFTTINRHGKHCVDYQEPNGRRRRVIVGDGTSAEAARREAEALNRRAATLRQKVGKVRPGDVAAVVQIWLDGDGKDWKGKLIEVAPLTAAKYRVLGKLWVEFFGRRAPRWHLIDQKLVVAYRQARQHGSKEFGWTSHHAKTVHDELTALRQCAQWAWKHGEFHDHNPVEDVERPTLPKRLATPFDERQIAALVGAAKGDARRLAQLSLGLFCGLRREGIVELRVANVLLDGAPPRLKVEEKGAKERWVPLNDFVVTALRQCPPLDAVYWFGRPDSQALDRFSAEMCGFIRRTLGVQTARFHDTRHSFVTNLLRHDVPLEVVADLAGHSSVTTTMRYRKIVDREREQAVARLYVPPAA